MLSAEEYRARAALCKARAEETADLEIKREFQNLAHKWFDLAEREESSANDHVHDLTERIATKTKRTELPTPSY